MDFYRLKIIILFFNFDNNKNKEYSKRNENEPLTAIVYHQKFLQTNFLHANFVKKKFLMINYRNERS